MLSPSGYIARVLRTLWKRFQREGRLGHTLYVSQRKVLVHRFSRLYAWIAGYITTNGVRVACNRGA